MLAKLLLAWSLMAACVVLHALGVSEAVRWLKPHAPVNGFWAATWLLVRMAGAIVLVHCAEVLAWALVYRWQRAMPDLQSAVYFSAVTYTTTGYGDLLLPRDWQLLGAVEALTGILMCGWSTGFFFVVVSRLVAPAGDGGTA
jgi:hypothetical protein